MKDNKEIDVKSLKTNQLNIVNPYPSYEEEYLKKLNFNIEIKKEVYKLANNNEEIIKKYLPFIIDYIDDNNICSNCRENSLRLCKKKNIGYQKNLLFEDNKFILEDIICPLHKKILNRVKSIYTFGDNISYLELYLTGQKIIDYYNDMAKVESIKSEIKIIISDILKHISHINKNNIGYLIYSKDVSVSNKVLKAISLLFNNKGFKVSYINANEFFNYIFDEDSISNYEYDYNNVLNSDVLLIENIEKLPHVNLTLLEEYFGKLLEHRNNNKLLTYASINKTYNLNSLSNIYFSKSNNLEIYKTCFNNIFKEITIKDKI